MNQKRLGSFVACYAVPLFFLMCWSAYGAATPQCSNPRITYFGGPVLANVQVVPVFYGANVNAQVVAAMPQFYADITASSYWSWLCEYDTPTQHIGPGTSTPGYVLPVNTTNPTSTTDDALQSLLVQQVALGNLPAPNSNTLYMVHFPANVSIGGPGGFGHSCVDFCAYHNSFASGNTVYVYSVIMDTFTAACASGCGGNATGLANQTDTASHELIESVTDPYIGLDLDVAYAYPCGWADNNDSCGELADVCDDGGPGDTITVSGRTWVVQEIWSDCQAMCVSSGPLPVADNQNLTTFPGTPLPITLSVSGACHYQVFAVTNGPAHGTLSGSSSNLVYTPAPGFAGQDSFQFTANGSPGTVNITVVPLAITTATFDATKTNFVVCWNSAPGLGYTVLTNGMLTALSTWTPAGTTNATASSTCFVLGAAPDASSRIFVAIKQN